MKRILITALVALTGASCSSSDEGGAGSGGTGDSTVSCVDSLVYDMGEYSFVSGPDMKLCMILVDQLMETTGMSKILAPGPGQKTAECEKENLAFNDKVCTLTGDQVCSGQTLRWDCHYESDSGTCTLKVEDCELMLTLTNAAKGIGGRSGSGGSGGSGGDGVGGVDGGTLCAFDGDGTCDEPDLCPVGTDSDCDGGTPNCEYEADGYCDVPGSCEPGTDTVDCTCASEDDGECDVPGLCAYGTDIADCTCASENDAFCDVPSLCMPGTDTADCSCDNDEFEGNDSEAEATTLGAISDCDSDETTVSATVGTTSDVRDVDVYVFSGSDFSAHEK